MRVTVHRVDVALYCRDDLQTTWREHSFSPAEAVVMDRGNGWSVVWSASQPFEVEAPALSRLADVDLPRNPKIRSDPPPARRRLVTPTSKWGFDATSVLHAAERGLDGFRLARAGEARKQEVSAPPLAVEPEKQATPAQVEPTATRWGIQFAPRDRPGDRSFLNAASLIPGRWQRYASTLDPAEAATWPDYSQADTWMRAAGFNPDQPVPLGTGMVYPSVGELSPGMVGSGLVWSLPAVMTEILADRAANPAPVPVAKPPVAAPVESKRPATRAKVLVGQLSFNW